MKKSSRIALGAIGAVGAVVLLAVFVADRKMEFLWSAPRVSHDTLVKPDTCAQIVICPEAALSRLAQFAPNAKLPPWALNMVVPYEIALLSAADTGAESADVTVFINDRRLGPMMQKSAGVSNLTALFPSVKWAAKEFQHDARGKLSLTGTVGLRKSAVSAVSDNWSALGSYTPLKVEGKHLLEAALDNRWGGVFALAASLPRENSPEALFFQDANTVKMLAGISVLRAVADLGEGNTATVDLDILTNPQANMIFTIKLLLDGSVSPLNEALNRSYGVTLTGSTSTEGDTIKGHYVLSNVDRFVAAAAGAK